MELIESLESENRTISLDSIAVDNAASASKDDYISLSRMIEELSITEDEFLALAKGDIKVVNIIDHDNPNNYLRIYRSMVVKGQTTYTAVYGLSVSVNKVDIANVLQIEYAINTNIAQLVFVEI